MEKLDTEVLEKAKPLVIGIVATLISLVHVSRSGFPQASTSFKQAETLWNEFHGLYVEEGLTKYKANDE